MDIHSTPKKDGEYIASARRKRVGNLITRRCFPLFVFGICIYLIVTERYVCPFYAIFGIPCAGCGMTRAYRALLQFDIATAFRCHCLFPLPLFWAAYHAIRRFEKLDKRVENMLLWISVILFLLRWISVIILIKYKGEF